VMDGENSYDLDVLRGSNTINLHYEILFTP
jgi:hypothetical protein